MHHKLIDNLNLYYECAEQPNTNNTVHLDENRTYNFANDLRMQQSAEQMIRVFPAATDNNPSETLDARQRGMKQMFKLKRRAEQVNEEDDEIDN